MKAASGDRRNFIRYPTNRVVGTVSDAAEAAAVVEDLVRAGIEREDIDVLHGEDDLERLDPTGAHHGFIAQFQRRLIKAFELEEFKHLTHQVEDVRAGRFVIMALTRKRLLRIAAADILHAHRAKNVGFYGRWAVSEIPPNGRRDPEDIPVLFAKAWNNHDADALASLFDEDAEFVNVAGLCWHDRESIRRAHAEGEERVFNKSTLAAGDTRVKLVSPDVAVVHARMTVTCNEPTGPVTRTTVVSFVAHRAGEKWVCASAQNTDVVPEVATGVMGGAGALSGAPQPSPGQAT